MALNLGQPLALAIDQAAAALEPVSDSASQLAGFNCGPVCSVSWQICLRHQGLIIR